MDRPTGILALSATGSVSGFTGEFARAVEERPGENPAVEPKRN
jgi:hypothetical protein